VITNVELDGGDIEGQRVAEAIEAVFQTFAGGPAMSDDVKGFV
jgi:hypothetical protein